MSSLIPPPSNNPTATAHPDILPYPPPQIFDILPEIHALIARVQLPSSSSSSNNNNNPADASSTSQQPYDTLSPKDLPAAAVPIKLKIQKARAAVQALPDVGRTIEEQEREIRALERRNEGLREKVRKLARLAGDARGN